MPLPVCIYFINSIYSSICVYTTILKLQFDAVLYDFSIRMVDVISKILNSGFRGSYLKLFINKFTMHESILVCLLLFQSLYFGLVLFLRSRPNALDPCQKWHGRFQPIEVQKLHCWPRSRKHPSRRPWFQKYRKTYRRSYFIGRTQYYGW